MAGRTLCLGRILPPPSPSRSSPSSSWETTLTERNRTAPPRTTSWRSSSLKEERPSRPLPHGRGCGPGCPRLTRSGALQIRFLWGHPEGARAIAWFGVCRWKFPPRSLPRPSEPRLRLLRPRGLCITDHALPLRFRLRRFRLHVRFSTPTFVPGVPVSPTTCISLADYLDAENCIPLPTADFAGAGVEAVTRPTRRTRRELLVCSSAESWTSRGRLPPASSAVASPYPPPPPPSNPKDRHAALRGVREPAQPRRAGQVRGTEGDGRRPVQRQFLFRPRSRGRGR